MKDAIKPFWLVIFFLALFLLVLSNIQFSHLISGKKGIVVSEHRLASEAGVAVLKQGGNAIDAAVAVGYALAVVNPCCGNIGGGGFMTIHLANGKNIFINFREKAPLKARHNMYLDDQNKIKPGASTNGYLAVGVPGTVLGLDTALMQYGTMTRQQVMAPAIQLAKQGFTVTPYLAKQLRELIPFFATQPSIAAIFEHAKLGSQLIQTNLANTLELIANEGPKVFYQGDIAKVIVQESTKHGGILTLEDFSQYTVQQLSPILCQYRGYQIISAAPPSSGGTTLCELLNIAENFPLSDSGFHTAKSSAFLLEDMRYSFIDRNTKLGDPDFVHNPIEQLTSKEYAKEISNQILHRQTTSPVTLPREQEQRNTTHYSVIDSKGNAVSVTYTLNGYFGAKVIAGNTGFFLNNDMDDFTVKAGKPNKFDLIQDATNAIQPGKRPLSSMTPTIILKDNHVFMVVGSPGGPRIITSVFHTIINVIDYGMNIEEAVNAPRFHYQVNPPYVDVEPTAFSPLTTLQLKREGYFLEPHPPWSAVEAILIDPITNIRYGANDYRRPDGAAISEE